MNSATPILELRPIRDEQDWRELADPWRELEAAAPAASVFHTCDWFRPFWANVLAGAPKWTTWRVTAAAGDGRLAWLCPFAVKTIGAGPLRERTLYFGGAPHRDYGGALRRGDYQPNPATLTSALGRLEWDRVILDALGADEAEFFQQVLAPLCARLRVRADAPVSGCPLAADAESLLGRVRGRSSLKNMQVRERRLVRDHGTVEFATTTHPSGAELNAFFLMHRREWGNRRSRFRLAAQRDFFIALAALGTLAVLDRLLAGGRPIAMLFGFQHRRRYYYYTPTYDRAFAYYSPGHLLLHRVIRRLAAAECDYFDFLRGDMGYKRDYPAALQPRARVEGYRRGRRGVWSRILRAALAVGGKKS